MGEMWRSQEMEFVELVLQQEAAVDTIDELGKLGMVEFKDENETVNPMNRKFVNEVKRAEDMESKVVYLENLILKYNEEQELYSQIPIPDYDPATDLGDLDIDDLEARLKEETDRAQEQRKHEENLDKENNKWIEVKHVLEKADRFFVEAQSFHPEDDDAPLKDSPLLLGDDSISSSVKLGFITGVILREKFAIFERILFRATRGNLYMRYEEIEDEIRDPHTRNFVKKNVFIVFFQGEKLQTKIKKICESFAANLYPCPDTPNERHNLLKDITRRIKEHKELIDAAESIKRKHYPVIANELNRWKNKVIKQKAIYHTMNMFDFDTGRKTLYGRAWIPKNKREEVEKALFQGKMRSHAQNGGILNPATPPRESPPTYFPTNKFTVAFQEIVNAYGIPRYREINPAVFTIITFPFLFGVMFGDVGHGFMLLAATLYLLYKEKEWVGKKLNELIQMPFDGRYVLLLMSIFGIYCGAIYNEIFSVPANVFKTNWALVGDNVTTQFDVININRTYPFGVDPAWKGATNELLYYNSLKMKMSIVLGVTHMCLGIVMKFLNSIYFRKELDLIFECIPQLLLMLSLFGYLVFLIFLKWSYPWLKNDKRYSVPGSAPDPDCGEKCLTSQAPLLLSTMIYMFLSPFRVPADVTPLFEGQGMAQGILLIIAAICVPMMLLPKPLILRARNRNNYATIGDEESNHGEVEHHGGDEHGEEFDFGETMVHQIIETIEFVLGSVSNTASYLRLWALSLAHSELSTVFWNLGFAGIGLSSKPYGFALVFFMFGAWFGVTIGVLLIMETLSAFLHALRLHWVEFQNKFYKGDGRRFVPFSYELIFAGINED